MIDSASGSTAGAPAAPEPGSSVVLVYRRVEMAFTVLSRCCFDAGYRSRGFGVVAEPHQSRVSASASSSRGKERISAAIIGTHWTARQIAARNLRLQRSQ